MSEIQHFNDIHATDLIGPLPRSRKGSKWCSTHVDSHTRWLAAYGIKSKCDMDTLSALKRWIKVNRKMKMLRSDNGREYLGKYKEFCINSDIARRFTLPYTPAQNGLAETYNKSLTRLARKFLVDSGLGVEYWEDAMEAAAHVLNRIPRRALKGESAFERRFKFKPDLSSLRPFGAKVFYKPVGPKKPLGRNSIQHFGKTGLHWLRRRKARIQNSG